MLEEFTLRLIRPDYLGLLLMLLLLLFQLSLHRCDRLRRARGSGLHPGRRQDEAAEHHGHRDQSDGRDPGDLDRRALRRRSHVCLRTIHPASQNALDVVRIALSSVQINFLLSLSVTRKQF